MSWNDVTLSFVVGTIVYQQTSDLILGTTVVVPLILAYLWTFDRGKKCAKLSGVGASSAGAIKVFTVLEMKSPVPRCPKNIHTYIYICITNINDKACIMVPRNPS